MTRTWLLTSTTYGTWLPGDARGFVSEFVSESGKRDLWNVPHTPYARNMPKLKEYARSHLKTLPVLLTEEQSYEFLIQVFETVNYRGWTLWAAAVMSNHFHLILEALQSTDHEQILQSIKSYGSRRLNKNFGKRLWWTQNGSARALYTPDAIESAVAYVLNQADPLVRWSPKTGILLRSTSDLPASEPLDVTSEPLDVISEPPM